MKRFKFHVSVAGPDFSHAPGSEAVIRDAQAEGWQECGHGVVVGDAGPDPAPEPEPAPAPVEPKAEPQPETAEAKPEAKPEAKAPAASKEEKK